jgi:hypothetical protein
MLNAVDPPKINGAEAEHREYGRNQGELDKSRAALIAFPP